MSKFEHHARTVSLLTFVSRISGLGRDAALSRVFGAGVVMDAFFFAFMIPNLLRRLFGEGALAAAFLPVFSRLDRDDPAMARSLASLTLAGLAVGLGAIVLVTEVVLIVVSSRGGHEILALRLLMIMLPYMPLVCLVAILGAMLQVRQRFGPTAAAPILLNGCLIAAALGFGLLPPSVAAGWSPDRARIVHVELVAVSVVVAGVLQVTWSLWALRRERWWTRALGAARAPMRAVVVQALPMIVGLGVLQLNTFVDGLIAAYPTVVGPRLFGLDYPLEAGAISAVSFAQRLYQFPLGVFGIAVATAIFPVLTRAVDDAAFTDVVRRGVRLVVFIGLPAGAGLVLVREPLTAVVLQGGAFTSASTVRVSAVLLGYAPAIWAYSMTHVLTRAFYARGDAMTPVRVAVGMVVLNLILNLTLIWTPLREAGLAWSTAICATIQAVVLLRRLAPETGGLVDRGVRRSWIGSVVATAIMASGAGVAAVLLVPDPGAAWPATLVALVAVVGAGLVLFALAARTLRMPELAWALGRRS